MINEHWRALGAYLAPFSEAELLTPLVDWSMRDHVVHLTDWERCAWAALEGRPFFNGLRLERMPVKVTDYEAINAILHDRAREVPFERVSIELRDVHSAVLAALARVRDEALNAPFVSPGISQGKTLIEVVANNTCLHYIEHLTWMREQLAASQLGFVHSSQSS